DRPPTRTARTSRGPGPGDRALRLCARPRPPSRREGGLSAPPGQARVAVCAALDDHGAVGRSRQLLGAGSSGLPRLIAAGSRATQSELRERVRGHVPSEPRFGRAGSTETPPIKTALIRRRVDQILGLRVFDQVVSELAP